MFKLVRLRVDRHLFVKLVRKYVSTYSYATKTSVYVGNLIIKNGWSLKVGFVGLLNLLYLIRVDNKFA